MSFGGSGNFPDYGATDSRFGSTRTSKNASKTNDMTTYHQLCDDISCYIFSINNNVTALERASREVGTSADTPALRGKIHETQQSTKELVSSTTKFLKQLTSLVVKGDREQRLQSERVRNEFRATVQRYDTLQKQLGPKMKLALLQQSRVSNHNAWVEDEDDERQNLMDAERVQQQKQIQDELEFEQGLLVERERMIRQIESDMLDVNQIFRDLASMVHEQGEVIGTIEDNITTAAYNVEEGQQQLFKASNYQKSYRKKLCIFLVILLVIAVIISIIVAISYRS